jgi:hypothetical protein
VRGIKSGSRAIYHEAGLRDPVSLQSTASEMVDSRHAWWQVATVSSQA